MVYGELNKIVKLLLPSSGPLKKQLNLGEEVLGDPAGFKVFSPSSFAKATPDHHTGISSSIVPICTFKGNDYQFHLLTYTVSDLNGNK